MLKTIWGFNLGLGNFSGAYLVVIQRTGLQDMQNFGCFHGHRAPVRRCTKCRGRCMMGQSRKNPERMTRLRWQRHSVLGLPAPLSMQHSTSA